MVSYCLLCFFFFWVGGDHIYEIMENFSSLMLQLCGVLSIFILSDPYLKYCIFTVLGSICVVMA